jgi:glycerophosphoryl diester phosphodiesterase
VPSPTRPLLIAHRAGNHLDTLELAAHAGAHLIEVDVWFHRGRVEVGHDKTLGPIPVRWDRWSLGLGWRRRLGLRELLEELPDDVELFFDLKGGHPALPAALRSMIDELIPARPYGVSSQNWSYLEPFLKVDRARVIRSIGSKEALQQMRGDLDGWAGAGIGLHFQLLTPEVIAELRERTPLIVTWTINNLEQANRLVRQGVGGIITDRLELIRAMSADPVE